MLYNPEPRKSSGVLFDPLWHILFFVWRASYVFPYIANTSRICNRVNIPGIFTVYVAISTEVQKLPNSVN